MRTEGFGIFAFWILTLLAAFAVGFGIAEADRDGSCERGQPVVIEGKVYRCVVQP